MLIVIDPEKEYSPIIKALGGEVIKISATSSNHINAMDMNSEYGDGANPIILKSEFILSLCEQLIGSNNLGAKQKSIDAQHKLISIINKEIIKVHHLHYKTFMNNY